MDDSEFRTRAGRLEQIGKVLEKLPAEVRSDAFDLLKGYVTEGSSESPPKRKPDKPQREETDGSDEEFFSTFDHDKPADNARLIAAWFYREYGVEPFSLDEVRDKATGVGITIPERVDMTFVSAKEKGKKLFARAGIGKFKPTVHGEANLKATYTVKKGTKKRPGAAE
ncbi:MAG: hypothetical protein ACT4PU_11970 [Planctomycetota bacterium]